jgi:hypothetical protein
MVLYDFLNTCLGTLRKQQKFQLEELQYFMALSFANTVQHQ